MDEINKYGVCTICTTYNQSAFIEDTMNGFCMQQTTFPYICVILDDASNDGEQKVIDKYLNDNFLSYDIDCLKETSDYIFYYYKHKQNHNCYFAVYYLKYNHYKKKDKYSYLGKWKSISEFVALCEGDDYWTDSLKLQIQYDFLKQNPQYSFCCHRYKIFNQETGMFLNDYAYSYYVEGKNLEIDETLFLRVWVTQTLATMIRMEDWLEILDLRREYKMRRDVHTYYFLLQKNKGVSLNRFMGVYRWNVGGVASKVKPIIRYRTQFEIYKELLERNQEDIQLIPKVKNCGIHYLLCSKIGKDFFDAFKYMWSLSGTIKERLKVLLSIFVPSYFSIYLFNNRREHRNNNLLISS